jgi:urease subunit alpha
MFVSHLAIDKGLEEKLDTKKVMLPVKNTRNIGKKDMKLNDFIGDIQVDPETYDVTVNGEIITSSYQEELPMAKKYFLF